MLHSKRIQRANRLNNIEHCRLKQQVVSLEQEKTHTIRMTNQDIRLISLTLDYIQSCSGHSPEGLSPEYDDEDRKSDAMPCFLYGERLISRQKRRFIRPQSAMEKSGSHITSTTTSESSVSTKRPRSSLMQQSTFVTKIHDISFADDSELNSRASSPISFWGNEPSPFTKKLLQAQSAKDLPIYMKDRFRQQSRSTYSVRSLARQLKAHATLSFAGISSSVRPRVARVRTPRKDENKKNELSRNAGLTEILNQARPTLSASVWRSHINQSQTTPRTKSEQRVYLMDKKKHLNADRSIHINGRLNEFLGE